MTIQANGMKEALRDLGKIDPALRREIGKDIRQVVKPLVDTINSRIPGAAPLSGMNHNGRTGWARRKAVAIKLDTRKPRNHVNRPFQDIVSVVRVTTKDAPTAIVDMAGKAGGSQSRAAAPRQRPNFAPALSARLGQPSRFMWRDIDGQILEIQNNLKPIIDRIEDETNRALKVNY